MQFDLSTIRAATNNFSDANKLGKGGFGIGYNVGKHYDREILSIVYQNELNICSSLNHGDLNCLIHTLFI